MSIAAGLQIAGANLAIGALVLSWSLLPKATDRAVYVVRLPWTASGNLQRRIAAVGGIPVAIGPLSIVTTVVLSDVNALSRLIATGGALVLRADLSTRCTVDGAPNR